MPGAVAGFANASGVDRVGLDLAVDVARVLAYIHPIYTSMWVLFPIIKQVECVYSPNNTRKYIETDRKTVEYIQEEAVSSRPTAFVTKNDIIEKIHTGMIKMQFTQSLVNIYCPGL